MKKFPFELIKSFDFNRKEEYISLEERLTYQIALITLILKKNAISQTASLFKIQIFMWGLKNSRNQAHLFDYVNGKQNFLTRITVEDDLNLQAIKYTLKTGYTMMTKNGKVKLDQKGLDLSEIIIKNDLFLNTSKYLDTIGKTKISDKKLQVIYKGD